MKNEEGNILLWQIPKAFIRMITQWIIYSKQYYELYFFFYFNSVIYSDN